MIHEYVSHDVCINIRISNRYYLINLTLSLYMHNLYKVYLIYSLYIPYIFTHINIL